jgi:hypothetical protein
VVYIDTEMKFSERRLVQIMMHQLQQAEWGSELSVSARNCDTLVKRIHVIRPQTGMAQQARNTA